MRLTPYMRVWRSRLRAFSLIEVSVALSMGIVLIGSLIWLSSTFGQMINGTVSDTLFTTELPQAASVVKTIIHNSLQLRIYTSLAAAEADTTGTNAVNFQTAGTGDVIRILLVNSDGSRSWAIIDCSNPSSWNYFLDHNSALPAVGIPAGSQLSSETPSWGCNSRLDDHDDSSLTSGVNHHNDLVPICGQPGWKPGGELQLHGALPDHWDEQLLLHLWSMLPITECPSPISHARRCTHP